MPVTSYARVRHDGNRQSVLLALVRRTVTLGAGSNLGIDQGQEVAICITAATRKTSVLTTGWLP